MSDIDLSAAINEAALVHLDIDHPIEASPLDLHYAKKHVRPLIEAVLPLIEQALRRQIARDIEASSMGTGSMAHAARIVRGDS